MKILEAIKAVKHAVSKDPTRSNLQTIRLEPDSGGTIAIATDGHRLAVAHAMENGITPRTLDLTDATVRKAIKLGDRAALLESESEDQQFPEWRQVVPTDHPCKVEVDRRKLIACVREIHRATKGPHKEAHDIYVEKAAKARVALAHAKKALAEEKAEAGTRDLAGAVNGDKLWEAVQKAKAHLANVRGERPVPEHGCVIGVPLGEFLVWRRFDPPTEVPAQVTGEGPKEIGLDSVYLLEALRRFSERKVTLELAHELAPVRIITESGYEVIMPYRL